MIKNILALSLCILSSTIVSAMGQPETAPEQIKAEDIVSAARVPEENPDAISYFANLSNGDILTCTRFRSGAKRGEIHCSRHYTTNFHGMRLEQTAAVDKSAYSLIRSLIRSQQPETPK